MLLLSIAVFALLFSPALVASSGPPDVIINEIAWMGTNLSYNDEWVELYNNTGSEITLDGWIFRAADGKIAIDLQGKISPEGFYILERTDDNTLPQITADQIYSGSLNNEGLLLELLNNDGALIDKADFSAGWSAGDNKTKQTMERRDFLSWQNSQDPGGTPKRKNSQPEELSPAKNVSTDEALPTLAEQEPKDSFSQADNQKLAVTKEQLNKNSILPFAVLMIALILAVTSGILMLLIKKKLKER
ncbi:MAG: lamin tail domain-containing protein [Candidatus Nealsonbacteria bacterium]